MKKLLSLLLCLCVGASLFAQVDFEKSGWKKVLDKAKAEDKLIFVDVYTTWCGPCRKMDQEVFTKPAVADYINENFIAYKANAEGNGRNVAMKFGVRSYPTFLVVNGQGKLVGTFRGFMPPDRFLYKLKSAAQVLDGELGQYQKEYPYKKKDPEFLYRYTIALAKANDSASKAMAQEYLNTQRNWDTPKNRQFIWRYGSADPAGKPFKYIVENKAFYYEQIGEQRVQQRICDGLFFKHARQSDTLEGALEGVKKDYEKIFPEKADELYMALSLKHRAMQMERDTSNLHSFMKEAMGYLENYETCDDWQLLQKVAWTFCLTSHDADYLNKAIKWAGKAIQLNSCYETNYTLAALLYRLDQYPAALKYANDALALAEEERRDTNGVKNFISELEKKID